MKTSISMTSFFKVSDFASWKILQLFGRVEASNDSLIIQDLRNFQKLEHRHFALDLSQCQSVNLRFIMEVAKWADWLKEQKGELIFLAPQAAVQRSIDIFVGRHRVRQVESSSEMSLQVMFGAERLKRTAAWQKSAHQQWSHSAEETYESFASSSLKA
jgi:hypothetical protein